MRIMPADEITQSTRVSCTISMMVRTPRPLIADAPREGLDELDLGRGIRTVAELVLQPLEAQPVHRARQDGSAASGNR
jgi:hypothetical protein